MKIASFVIAALVTFRCATSAPQPRKCDFERFAEDLRRVGVWPTYSPDALQKKWPRKLYRDGSNGAVQLSTDRDPTSYAGCTAFFLYLQKTSPDVKLRQVGLRYRADDASDALERAKSMFELLAGAGHSDSLAEINDREAGMAIVVDQGQATERLVQVNLELFEGNWYVTAMAYALK